MHSGRYATAGRRKRRNELIEAGFVSAFLVGLLGGVHCLGMCGGLVTAFSLQIPQETPKFALHLAYNLGRLSSYALAGLAAGALGAGAAPFGDVLPVQYGLYVVANVVLIALGFYLAGWSQAVLWLERAGSVLWRRVQPLGRRFLPARTPARAFFLGTIWGWLPCGMVYSLLVTALAAGSAPRGAGIMLAFGLGTLPNLLAIGSAAQRLTGLMQKPAVRRIAGLVVAGFGAWGLLHVL